MILPRLLRRFASHRDDAVFYQIQANDAVRWIFSDSPEGRFQTALDLGCGHGVFGGALKERGLDVTFADEKNFLLPGFATSPFVAINLDTENIQSIGQFDLVICSNVLEHLRKPERLLGAIPHLLSPKGCFYLSWTNWLSPWGGHEFSPFHYLGPERGTKLYDRLVTKPRFHHPGKNLFPTYIGEVLSTIRKDGRLEIVKMAPRYYTELSFLLSIPYLREYLAWNCAILLRRKVL